MKRIHLFTAAAVLSLAGGLIAEALPANAATRAPASTASPTNRSGARPASASATPASAAICDGTSLVTGYYSSLEIRVPTVANGDGEWQCNLLPSDGAGLVPVKRLQIDLNDCYGYDLKVDGEYGPDTEAAVKEVQAAEHVTQDGDYGPQTIKGGFTYHISDEPTRECDIITGS